MAALAAITASRAGVLSAGAAVSSSDTIDGTIIGSRGCLLEIINGNASSDSMSISDASTTVTGAAAASNAPSVANATSKVFKITAPMADPTTGKVTITHSVTSTVTYKLYPLG